MAQITAALVKELRDKTGAGMMDCKKALTETGGDVETAVDWLRKKGLSAAAKKAGRVAAQGLIGVGVEGTTGAVVEVNSETDFVGRNEQFQNFVRAVTGIALNTGGASDAILAAQVPGGERTVADEVTHLVATIGENISFRRAAMLAVEQGHIARYVHGAVVDGLGTIGVLVALKSAAGEDVLAPLGKQLAMHVAAANPQSLTVDELDPTLIEREKAVQMDKARESGKPETIIEKMIEGRMRKYYEEVVLLKQTSVIDGETRIEAVIADAAKQAGTPIELTRFVRFQLGEGIEKEEADFAAEVAAAAGA